MADFDRFRPVLAGRRSMGPWKIEWAPGRWCREVSNGPLGPRYAVGYRMGPGAGPRAPPGDGHRHRKTVTGKSYLKTFGMIRGSFWPKLVKSMCFKPNGRHEQFRSAFFIGKSSVGSQKALTRTPFVTDRGPAKPARPVHKVRFVTVRVGRFTRFGS